MHETLDRDKAEQLVVLECANCGHREQVLQGQTKGCPICGGSMSEAPEFDFADEEWR
jgi:rubrerythrin